MLPYVFHILVLVPIASLTLLGGEKGGQLACQGKFRESEGFRTILGSLWMAILIGSGLGLLQRMQLAIFRQTFDGGHLLVGDWWTDIPP